MTKIPKFKFKDIPEGAMPEQIPRNGFGRIKSRYKQPVRECYISSSYRGLKIFIAVLEGEYFGVKIPPISRWWIDNKYGRICDSFEYPE